MFDQLTDQERTLIYCALDIMNDVPDASDEAARQRLLMILHPMVTKL